MNDIPRTKLVAIIKLYGPAIIDEPRRVEGLLKDLCGEHKREIFALMDAAGEHVASELRAAAGSGQPPELLAATLVQRLLENRPMSEEAARWAVESWAEALGVAVKFAPLQTRAADIRTSFFPASAPKAGAAATNPTPGRPQEMILTLAPKVELALVHVPAGKFSMGSDTTVDREASIIEGPQHIVELEDFWIGKYPVTNLQYQAFVQAAAYRMPTHWKNKVIPTGLEQHPVTWVCWPDAAAFCYWAGGLPGGHAVRLPSEAEWEKAARGTDKRVYPWGNVEPDATRCNFDNIVGITSPVGRFSPRGDSPYGCVDMAGNVFEWCGDWYEERYYRNSSSVNPTGASSGGYRVHRGGSFTTDRTYARCASRSYNSPQSADSTIGFRILLLSTT